MVRRRRCFSGSTKMLCLLFLFATISSMVAEDRDVPLVEVIQGTMKGSLDHTVGGRKVASFRGIPYAEPPVGELRFRAPVPLNLWDGVLDATKEGPPCIQKDIVFELNSPIIGQEDCLFLNVYVPLDVLENVKQSEHAGEVSKKVPVMVYIHGGGWLSGSGGAHNFGPQLLLDKDVILVTMNYRLSAFGFLSTGDAASPGNFGLKDQSLALKWVNQNIAAFGGDHNKVTIFGQSAGGASVHYHILSPLSKDLFQNGVSHSGNALAPWAFARDAPTHAKTLAGYLNCPTGKGSQALVECLRSKDAVEITKKFELFLKWDIDPLIVFGPTIEDEGNDEKPFITNHPYEIMKTGKFNKVNWMAGLTSEDGAWRTACILADPQKEKQINDEFNNFIGPVTLRLEETAKDPQDVAKKVRKLYFGDNAIGMQNHIKLTELYNDRYFLNGFVKSFHFMKNFMSPSFSSYFYIFSYRGQYSLCDTRPLINKTSNTPADYGVAHCDDLIYLLPMRDFVKGSLKGNDAQMSKIMLELWTDFAETGNPTPDVDTLIPIKWEPVNPEEIHLLEMCDSPEFLKMVPLSEDYLSRYKFWESLNLAENENYISKKKRDEL